MVTAQLLNNCFFEGFSKNDNNQERSSLSLETVQL